MRRRVPILIGVWGLLAATLVAADEIRVVSLVRQGQVLVSFWLDGGLAPEMRESIRSGLETKITYDIELRRSVPVWFDRTVATASVTASARYDNLTRVSQLSRTIDGRGEEPRMTDNDETVRRWMMEFDRLALFSARDLEPNAQYYVQVSARSHPRFGWFFWPWDRGWATGFARFTFIP